MKGTQSLWPKLTSAQLQSDPTPKSSDPNTTTRERKLQTSSAPPNDGDCRANAADEQQQHDAMASTPTGNPPGKDQPGLRYPSNGKTIYHRPLNRSRTGELSQASFAYLFSEMVTYAQRKVTGIQDLEKR